MTEQLRKSVGVVLFEVTVEVRNLCVKLLFKSPPSMGRVCECIECIFSSHEYVKTNLVNMVLSVVDTEDETLGVDDTRQFREGGEIIGYIGMATRTLFDD